MFRSGFLYKEHKNEYICNQNDAPILVNHTLLTSVTHEEAIDILREAGPDVILTVKHYKSAAPFLLKNVRQFIPEQDPSSTSGK